MRNKKLPINMIKEIFKSQSFLLKNPKDFFIVDEDHVIKNFRSFVISDEANDFQSCRELVFALQQLNKLTINNYLISTLVDYLAYQNQSVRSYYSDITNFFEIDDQEIINVKHVISVFELNGHHFMLLSLMSDDLFVHCNSLLPLD